MSADLTLSYYRDPVAGVTRVSIIVPDDALVNPRLDGFDRLLLADCAGPGRKISDTLLGLETIARRYEEAQA